MRISSAFSVYRNQKYNPDLPHYNEQMRKTDDDIEIGNLLNVSITSQLRFSSDRYNAVHSGFE